MKKLQEIKKHLRMLAEKMSTARPLANDIIDQVKVAVQQWQNYAEEAGVTKASKKIIADVITN